MNVNALLRLEVQGLRGGGVTLIEPARTLLVKV